MTSSLKPKPNKNINTDTTPLEHYAYIQEGKIIF